MKPREICCHDYTNKEISKFHKHSFWLKIGLERKAQSLHPTSGTKGPVSAFFTLETIRIISILEKVIKYLEYDELSI
jgi:hypothetical protein